MAIRKVLIANRGEIAVRVVRTLREMGIGSVAVYSDPDSEAPHVRYADESVAIGPGPVGKSYLDAERIIDAARSTGADAIHPGYGFFAEHPEFARACGEAGVVWIGPPPEAIEAMGLKTRARRLMEEAGVPVVPGTITPAHSVEDAVAIARDIGFPVAFKTAGGGGGKGFHVARSEAEAAPAFERASTEGERFFANPDVYVEEYLEDPRHVEVQVLADTHGNVVHLFERDCSVRRRRRSTKPRGSASAGSPSTRLARSGTCPRARSRGSSSATGSTFSR
jgi:acetyl/propionyl-CoA carboxylase alpha subunit